MFKILLLVAILLFSVCESSHISGQTRLLTSSTRPGDTPEAGDTKKLIDSSTRERILRAIVDRYVSAARRGGHDFVDVNDPVVRQLTSDYPRLLERKEERGLLLRTIVRVLYSDTQNQEIINRLLANQTRRSCKEVRTHE
jgi:hypothetical protein